MSINIGDGTIKIIADPSGVDRELAKMGRKGSGAGKQVAAGLKPVSAGLSNIKKLALSVGAVFGAWQAFRILRDAARAALDFGKEFANVATLINTQTPVGVKQLKILKQQIFALRPELGSARDLTKGLYQALSAGAEPAQAVKLVGEAALFAKAALTDTLTAVDILTTSINAYGLSADDAASVSSVLFKTIEQGKITGQELAASLGRVIPIAANLNVSLPELNAALATMTKSGLSTAEAVTSLRAILKTLTSPEAIKRFEKLGISQAKMRDIVAKDGLNAALQELGKRLKGSTAATTDLFRETEAQVGVFTLLGEGSEEYKRILGVLIKAQKDATATAIAAKKQFATLDAKLETLKVTIEKELIIAFASITPAIEGVLTSFGLLGSEGKALRVILGAIAWSILVLSETIIFWIATIKLIPLLILKVRLAIAEWVGSNKTLSAIFGMLGTGVGKLRKDIDSLTDSIDADIDEMGKIEAQIKALGKALEAIPKKAPPAAAAIDEVGDAAGRVGEDFEKAGIKTVAVLQKEVAAARELALALINVGAPVSELNQAIDMLAEAEKALADAQKEVLGGFKEIKGEVKAVASEIVDHDAKLPPLIEKYNNLREALRTLGIEGSAALRETLTAAEQALEAIKVAAEVGLASNVDILAAEIEVMEIRAELWRALGQTIDESYLQKLEQAKEKLAEFHGETETIAGTFEQVGLSFDNVAMRMAESIGFAFQAAILGQRGLTEAIREGVAQVLAGIAGQALALSIFYLAKGFAALAGFGFRSATFWFKAAAEMGIVAGIAGVVAKTIAPPRKTATITGTRGEPIGVVTSAEEEEPGQLVVERRMAMGGLITRPTLAMLGERGPEVVVPLQGGGGVGGSAADRDGGAVGTAIQIFIEGMISPDVLDDVIQQISDRVEGSDVRLTSSTSLRVISRS